MSQKSLINLKEFFPETMEEFLSPWNEWFRKNNLFNRTTIPSLNITEEKDQYKVTVAAPGLKKEDFDIEVDNHLLTIGASSENEKEEENKRYRRKEYNYSSFSRSFTMPQDVNADSIEAHYDNGILTLNLSKKQPAVNTSQKRIDVK